jgi:hypothetical protein
MELGSCFCMFMEWAGSRLGGTKMLNSMQVTGYIDTSTLEIGVRVDVFGAHIFNLFGNLKDGVVGKIDLFLAKGEIRFYLKNGNGTIHFQHFAMKTV